MFHVGYRDVSGITVTKTITKPESLFKALSMMNRRIKSIESRSSSKCDCSLSLKKRQFAFSFIILKYELFFLIMKTVFYFGSRMGKNPAVYHENKEFDP